MAAYRQVYDSRYLQVDCQEPGSGPEPYAGKSSMEYRYLFTPGSQNQRMDGSCVCYEQLRDWCYF